MKYIFILTLLCLIVASILTWRALPDVQSQHPVLYWVTDLNPARDEQVRLFHEFLQKRHYPPIDLRLDTANKNVQKMIIQGVSGVGSDIMDLFSGAHMLYFHAMGILTDVTEPGLQLGFDPSKTYAAMLPEITIDGRQFMFPCNVTVHLLWVNKATFRRYGQPLPPRSWDFATFERLGKDFVKAANPPGAPRPVFYLANIDPAVMRRSLGLSVFNETLTRCVMNDPREIRVLKLLYKWTYEDRILPSKADQEAFDTEAGFGGAMVQIFNTGNYGMFRMGRYALIQLRKFGDLQLDVVHHPCDDFQNASTGARAAAIYAGSKNKDLAQYFLAYLASEEYNMQIVRDGDALPPNPAFTQTEEFLRPKDHPTEWGLHEIFSNAARDIAIGGAYSPFILPSVASRIIAEHEGAVLARRDSPETAARNIELEINDEIQRNLIENPKLRPLYDRLVARQKQIDELRDRGKPIPSDWIENPMLKRYHLFKGTAAAN